MIDYSKNHFAVLLSPDTRFNYPDFVKDDRLSKQLVFSNETINSLLEAEVNRDDTLMLKREGQSLRSMSSGERKVAVLRYLIDQDPDVLLVDRFYENLDAPNRKNVEDLLFPLNQHINFIQLVRKQSELFPFIEKYYIVDGDQLKPYVDDISNFFAQKNFYFSAFEIPKPATVYFNDYTTFVKLSDVSIDFSGKTVLQKINWEIRKGEFWQLLGENGSGKTTLLSLITGESTKAYGENIILFDKRKGTEANIWEIKQKIGYFTPAVAELFKRRQSVLNMLLSGFYDSIGLYVQALDSHKIIAYQWLQLLGLSDKAKASFSSLPLSQQRLLLIARAMVKHPPLLILDESTSGLDAQSTEFIVALINKIASETSTTIIYVSHTAQEGLLPNKLFKLTKTPNGSFGEIV